MKEDPRNTDEQIDPQAAPFVRKITDDWNADAGWALGIGRLLLEAKHELPDGTFMEMTAQWLPFSHNTANRFMQIAMHPVVGDSARVQTLPRSWGTLHALCRIPRAMLEKLIADGTINSEIERWEVEEILRRLNDEYANKDDEAENENENENKDESENKDGDEEGGDEEEDENKDYGDDRDEVKPRKRKKKHLSRDAVIVRDCVALIKDMHNYPQVDGLHPKYFAQQKIAKSDLKRLADWVGELADVALERAQAEIVLKDMKKKKPATDQQRAILEVGRDRPEERPAT